MLSKMCFRFGSMVLALSALAWAQGQNLNFLNHGRSVLDAHNCYPYKGQWNDRITRALKTGFPVAIEQDLAWYVDPSSQKGRVVVSHSAQPTGLEPTLRDYFFERVRPIVEQALRDNDRARWPLIVLHFDFKDNQAPLLHAVWDLLGQYQDWITTAPKTANRSDLAPFEPKPILVVTEDSDAQEQVFFNEVPVGSRLRLFGSAHTTAVHAENQAERNHMLVTMTPEQLLQGHPTNYRRWWNNSWYAVEEGGASRAGEWTSTDQQRLKSLVDYAHKQGFWIRFYTLDGFLPSQDQGWGADYNFGSLDAVRLRWKAAIDAGVDFIATDQYEELASFMTRPK